MRVERYAERIPHIESANENGGVSMYLRKPGASTGRRTITGLPLAERIFVAVLRRSKYFIVHWRQRRPREAGAQAAVSLNRRLVGRHRK